jgi:hypothetical protein
MGTWLGVGLACALPAAPLPELKEDWEGKALNLLGLNFSAFKAKAKSPSSLFINSFAFLSRMWAL